MTDSTTDTQSADGGFEVGSSVDDLFGEIESDGDSEGGQRAETDDGDGSDVVEDQTAADVFDQLRTDAGDENGADDILADESPDEIIASADEPDPEPDATVDADLLADDDELADLLLTGRSKETDGEFLWIDPADDAGTDGVEKGDEGRLEESADATPDWESTDATDDVADDTAADVTDNATDDTAAVEQSDAAEPITDHTDGDVDVDESASPNDTETKPESATSSAPEIISDDGSETISDSSDDGGSGLEEDETAPESAADGDDAEEEPERADADDAPSGPLSKVRATLGGLF
ncbi:hypothetical protein CP556_18640 [Natrinema sp. CBA1119]|uniref:hypothetical protein n=1 Tax=Natrinema sp. CBA1119 TaxID=1608465 RepID=UPI000BF3AAEA|nr:hypothetical protein [Natrinema sp. CBA1119]PGF17921.1 hypothetical protein CP556_18640 [Natrinema sp. CBA1119]